jgi:hypothetical protein
MPSKTLGLPSQPWYRSALQINCVEKSSLFMALFMSARAFKKLKI